MPLAQDVVKHTDGALVVLVGRTRDFRSGRSGWQRVAVAGGGSSGWVASVEWQVRGGVASGGKWGVGWAWQCDEVNLATGRGGVVRELERA